MAQTITEELAEEASTKIERKFRIGLWIASALAVLALVGCVVTAIRSANEFAPPEAVVAAQSLMLAHDGTLYYDFHHYPYTVAPYTPLFYLLDAGLQKAGLPIYTAGRIISFAAALGIVLIDGLAALTTTCSLGAYLSPTPLLLSSPP